ncbi:MAG: AMP-binding protein [Planctomycetes bacterium]|nr:AMP-binding protein [Planctomycetota bacterium]
MQRPWLKSYAPGVPAEIDADDPPHLAALFERAAERFAERPCLSSFGAELSYAEVERASACFAAYLLHELELAPGDRVALVLPNVLAYPVALFGVLRAGLVVVNLNPLYKEREHEEALRDSGARALVAFELLAGEVAKALPHTAVEHVILTRPGDLMRAPRRWVVDRVASWRRKEPIARIPGTVRFPDALERGEELSSARPEIAGEDLAFLQYTGGTTGVPKGAMLTHRNLVANVLQVAAVLRWVEPGEDVILTALPLYHIFALTANLLCFTHMGGCNLLIANPRDLQTLVRTLGRDRVTAITGVNTLFAALLDAPGFTDIDFSALKATVGGGASVHADVAARWERVTGKRLSEGYGLTEASPVVCVNPTETGVPHGPIGVPLPSTDCEVRDDAGRAVGIGERGELCVRGPQVMRGYWQKPAETAQVLDADGWLKTGDIAIMDERGLFRIVDRKKDMILVSGFNVYPNEVEEIVAAHPKVREVGVISVPDPHSDEAVCACVVKRDASLEAGELVAWCKERLTGYKVPHRIVFFDALPKSPVGKILRRELRALVVR